MRSTGLSVTLSLLLVLMLMTTGCGRKPDEAASQKPAEQGAGGETGKPPRSKGARGEPKGKPTKPSEVVIGVLVPLSGERRAEGDDFIAGLKLALREDEGASGLTPESIELADTADSTANMLIRLNVLMDDPRVCVVVGMMSEEEVNAIEQPARYNDLAVLTTARGSLKLSLLGTTVTRLAVDDEAEGTAAATFAVKTLSAKSAAILVDTDDPAAELRAKAFAGQFESLAGSAPTQLAYSSDARNFRRRVALIAGEYPRPEVVYIPGQPFDGKAITKAMASADFAARVIGSTDWDPRNDFDVEAGPIPGIYAVGRFVPDRTGPATLQFVQAWEADHDGEPPGPGAALGYDAGLVIIDVLKAGGPSRAGFLEALRKVQDVKGVTGLLAYDDGKLYSRVPILRLEGNRFVFDRMSPVK